MTALSDLKTRIITETQRDSLSDDLAATLTLHINQAIDFFATRRFWFNEFRTVSAFTSGNAYLAIPAGLRQIDEVIINIGPGYQLRKVQLTDIEDRSNVGGNAQPVLYAYYAASGVQQIRAWPTPNSAYGVTWIGTKDETALVNATDTNAWLANAYDLIAARTRFTLYRDQFKDADARDAANSAMQEALNKLTGETARRVGTGRVLATW